MKLAQTISRAELLKTLKIDGFRSLIRFHVELEPGLNVIVGANGTGKTNFLSFLDFLGEFVENDLNAGIAIAQGAGAVFSKEKFEEDRAELIFSLSGNFDTKNLRDRLLFHRTDENQSGTYEYSARITYLKDVPAVVIDLEELTLSFEKMPALSLRRTTSRDGGKFHSRLEISPKGHALIKGIYSWEKGLKEGKADLVELLSPRLSPEKSFLVLFYAQVDAISSMVADLTGLRSVNIDPSIARRPTPVGVGQDIGPRGEGLAGALYRLERGNYSAAPIFKIGKRFLQPNEQAVVYRSILSWCREVNPGVEGIRVDLDFQEALLRPYLMFERHGTTDSFSLSRISDGTVKWLALLAVLHLEPTLSIVEEPENFLHPFMQESFIALCRQLLKSDPFRCFLISTHSPTVLDCCAPSEMIIFDLEDGLSRASKVANRVELAEKIAKSRFGLGYYYRTGGVYGADSSDS
jgi:predicted ATPase